MGHHTCRKEGLARIRDFGEVGAVNSGQPRVLLIPEESLYLAFRLPKLFRKAGWDVDLLCLPGQLLRHSRYVRAVIEEKSRDALFERLKTILRDPRRRWQEVVVVHEGIARRLFQTNDVHLLESWQPGAIDPLVRDFVSSKFGMAAACSHSGFPVPPSRVCGSLEDIVEFGSTAGWPIMLKPPDQTAGIGVLKLDSPDQLSAARSSLTLPILAQKFISGRRGVVEMLCSGGKPLAWLASYSTRRFGGEYSPSTARLFRAMPKLKPVVEFIAAFARFEGFCGFDWIEEEATGRHWLIEFHPRAPSGFRFGRQCGVDFSAAIAVWLRRELATFSTQTQPEGNAVQAHYFSSDLFRCLRKRDWRGLDAWLPGSGACHDVFWDDLPLLASWVVHRSSSFLKGCLIRTKPNPKSS